MSSRTAAPGFRADELQRRLRQRGSRDPLVREIRRSAESTGVRVWVVGGYVRDAALGRRSTDLDLAAGRGAPEVVRALRASWGTRGFRVRKRGVTTWRFRVGERDVDLVDAGSRGLMAELRRRELTVNAIAFDPVAGLLSDPLGGLRDLRAGRLRSPRKGNFLADPIRTLRAARFLAQLPEMRLVPATRAEAAAAAPRLRRASVERVRDELDKLLRTTDPRRGLLAVERLGALDAVLPELVPLRNCVAGRDRPDVWRHTLDALDASTRPGRLVGRESLESASNLLTLRWALLLHDVAKPDTLAEGADGRPTFHGHEVLGARRADALLRRLRQPRALRSRVKRLVLHHLRPHHLADAGSPPRGMRRLVRESAGDLPLLLVHAACDARASGAPDAARRFKVLRRTLEDLYSLHLRFRSRPPATLVSGDDVMELLGVPPGPEVGEVLDEVRDLKDRGVLSDRDQALELLARKWKPGA